MPLFFIDLFQFTKDAFTAPAPPPPKKRLEALSPRALVKLLRILADLAATAHSLDYSMPSRDLLLRLRHEFAFSASF